MLFILRKVGVTYSPKAVGHVPGRRDALSGQSSELSVAKANEADAFGNAEVGNKKRHTA